MLHWVSITGMYLLTDDSTCFEWKQSLSKGICFLLFYLSLKARFLCCGEI